VLLAVAVAFVVYMLVEKFDRIGHILIVVMGFGGVVLVHEFGHFVVAKLSDIHVEAFSIGFPPYFLGILRTENGYRVRILPGFWPRGEGDDSEGNLFSFTVDGSNKAGETEYRVGLIPFGGFVKMLGQEDVKEVEKSDDPRSYANKPPLVRMGVIAAGVIFNAISAVIIFLVVFLHGINLTAPVIGGVDPGSPAEVAGLKAGDEVIAIAGNNDKLDFMNIGIAAALSGRDEKVHIRVRHEDGEEEDFWVRPKEMVTATGKLRLFGILQPQSLTIRKVKDADVLFEETSFKAGDEIVQVDGREVKTNWQMREMIENSYASTIEMTARRDSGAGEYETVKTELNLDLWLKEFDPNSESDAGYVCTMVPRLQVEGVAEDKEGLLDKFLAFLGYRASVADDGGKLQKGDIILGIGSADANHIDYPILTELRSITADYENKKMPIRVLRTDANGIESELTVTVVPKRTGEDVAIGIYAGLDAEHPVVARTVDCSGIEALEIPRGALITSVGGEKVRNYFDIIREIRKGEGNLVTIEYRVNEELEGRVNADLRCGKDFVTVGPSLSKGIPFDDLERLYVASGPVDALVMGYDRTVMFIKQAYVTLKRFVSGLVSPKNFMGPVGIFTLSYKIVSEKPIIYYVYFLGLISAFIGVFNSLPFLPFDGGHIVFLLIEKIKGSAVNERVQASVLYAGLAVVLAFALYVTFNDILRIKLFM
jgi:regulator of sigma E protease